jgi:uncharacterized protein (TIGR02145 family)
MKTTKHFLSAAISIALALAFSACDSGGGGGGNSNACGGKQYDQAKYGCVNDELVGTCNGSYYNPEYKRCNNGQVQDGAEITFPPSGGGGNGGGYSGSYGSVSHGGQSYKTVRIGNQTWMAENLNYDASGSVCYKNDPANCAKYGRLYDWATAMALPSSCNHNSCSNQVSSKHRGICPSGWHIPSDEEWITLVYYVGGPSTAGTKLKATSGWSNNGNGTDTYGFAALPGGRGNSGDDEIGNRGYWWSTTESAYDGAWICHMNYNTENIGPNYRDNEKMSPISVRCIKD